MHVPWVTVCRAMLCLALVSVVPSPAAAENLQKIYPYDHRIMQAVRTLYVESGLSLPYADGPYSEAEIWMFLEGIPRSQLSAAGRTTFELIRELLEPDPLYTEPGGFAFDLDAEANLEAYLRLDGEDVPHEYRYERRQPLLRLPFEVWIGDRAYGVMDIEFLKNYPSFEGLYEEGLANKNPDTVNPDPVSNVFSHVREIDVQVPHRGFLSVGGEHWNLQFGRDLLNWGNGRTGSMFVSDFADYHDYLRLSTFWNAFKFSTVWLSLEPWLRQGEAPVTDLHKSFLAHRFAWRIFDVVTVAYTESMMYGRDDMQLQYLIPFVSYHNWYINPDLGNALHSFDLEFAPLRSLRLYGQFVPDQWAGPLEEGDYTESEPNAAGYLAGADIRYPLGYGYLTANFEWVLTDPWLYIHEHALTSFFTRRRVQAENARPATKVLVDKPLGYWAGPDFLGYSLRMGYQRPGYMELTTGLDIGFKGEKNVNDGLPPASAEDAARKTPSGDYPERRIVIPFSGEVSSRALPQVVGAPGGRIPELFVGSEVALVWLTNKGNQKAATVFDLQWAGWVSVKY